MVDFAAARRRMVDEQIVRRGIADARVVAAMALVPRERFVAASVAEFAYDDSPLPIGESQTISQPYIVALMSEAAAIPAQARVLDVGTGSGYAAAVLSHLAREVYTIERHRRLAESARQRLAELGYRNVVVRHGDGTQGWPEAAPFDAILVAAGGAAIPSRLRDQLAIGGSLVMPVGPSAFEQRLVRLRRRDATRYDEEALDLVAFVPLVAGVPPEENHAE
jgi:protein-L-isoaspartate(D-aspartate) O-methyltransferase